MTEGWEYQVAFSRNLGLVTPHEQLRLRDACVAIAGMGGVGGAHLVTLARLGVGRFHLADFDHFEPANFNRQYGATTQTIGRPKVEVMADVVRTINPDAHLTLFDQGVTPNNSREFVQGADVVVDAVDFFAIDMKRLLFDAARAAGVPALTSGPLGFGATMHVFSPIGMSFDEYFDLSDGGEPIDHLIAFAVGLAPQGLHLRYLDLRHVDVDAATGPSSTVACQLASAFVGAETLKLLLKRTPVAYAPHYVQFDPYLQRFVKGRLPRGNRHLKQRLKRWLLKRKLEGRKAAVRPQEGGRTANKLTASSGDAPILRWRDRFR